MRGDGRALCTLERVGEGVPALAVGDGRWCISGNVGAVMLTEGTESRGCPSRSRGRSIVGSGELRSIRCITHGPVKANLLLIQSKIATIQNIAYLYGTTT